MKNDRKGVKKRERDNANTLSSKSIKPNKGGIENDRKKEGQEKVERGGQRIISRWLGVIILNKPQERGQQEGLANICSPRENIGFRFLLMTSDLFCLLKLLCL